MPFGSGNFVNTEILQFGQCGRVQCGVSAQLAAYFNFLSMKLILWLPFTLRAISMSTLERRRHRSESQWRSLIELHHASELSLRDFCLHHSLDAKYFSKKRIQLGYQPTVRRGHHASVNSKFATVNVAKAMPLNRPLLLKLNAVELSIPGEVSVQWLSSLLRSLS